MTRNDGLTHLVVQAPHLAAGDVDAVLAMLGRPSNAAKRIGADAIRIAGVEPSASIVQICRERRLDCAFVPGNRRLADVGLVAMDMDSTLITIECIDEIADMHGIKPQVAAITASAMRGEIDFPESLRRRVALLAGLEASALQRVYDERLQLSPGAEAMLAAFRAVGAKSLLVSSGFTFFTDRLQERLGLDRTVSNVLEIDDGRLTGRVHGGIVDAKVKADAVRAMRDAPGMKHKLVVCIGDGANDLPMLAEADVSVAYRAKPVVREKTTHQIDWCGLDAVVNLLA